MSSAWDDLGGRPLPPNDPYWAERNAARHAETYQEALARSLVNRKVVLTEQEMAERVVAGRERMRQHDAYFADGFLPIDEERIISRELARKLGYQPHQSREQEGQMPDDDGIGDDT